MIRLELNVTSHDNSPDLLAGVLESTARNIRDGIVKPPSHWKQSSPNIDVEGCVITDSEPSDPQRTVGEGWGNGESPEPLEDELERRRTPLTPTG